MKTDGMAFIPGGTFTMGSDAYYPEERPLRRMSVGDFWIDKHPVTNREFARFVSETGHVTLAESVPDPADYPGMDPALAIAGSLVFTSTDGPVPLDNHLNWWRLVGGADWRHPTGPGSSLRRLEQHPVVHVAYADALAYAGWAGKALASEAEWEFAARGGLEGREFAWGDELHPDGQMLANTWQGAFPYENTLEDGWERTSPVGAYPPNGHGIYDMIGNVWEWTSDDFCVPEPAANGESRPCCTIADPRNAAPTESHDQRSQRPGIPWRVIKGGSHLCAPSYCQRYRPAARQGQMVDTSTSHVGFRCILREQ